MEKQYHFKWEANIGEKFESFAERLLRIREQIRHLREDVLVKSEIYELACSHKYLGDLFQRKYRDDSVNIAEELSPTFTTEFNGFFITVTEHSTIESLHEQYEKMLPVPEELKEKDESPKKTSSERYRMMIYFAVATFHFYRKEIVSCAEGETLGDFAEKNKDIVKRVVDEARSLFKYELSHEQIGTAIGAYLAPAQAVSKTEVAQKT